VGAAGGVLDRSDAHADHSGHPAQNLLARQRRYVRSPSLSIKTLGRCAELAQIATLTSGDIPEHSAHPQWHVTKGLMVAALVGLVLAGIVLALYFWVRTSSW
jgi:hypothetical protein